MDSIFIAGLESSKQGLVAIHDSDGVQDALLGLAFPNRSLSGMTPVFDNLRAANARLYPQFSFYFGRNGSGSQLTLGGNDTSMYQSPNTVLVTKESYWQIAVDGMTANGNSVGSIAEGQAAVDTGTILTFIPTEAATAVFKAIPNSIPYNNPEQPGTTFYAYPCDTDESYMPTFILNGRPMPINVTDFNAGALNQRSAVDVGGAAFANQIAAIQERQNIEFCGAAIVGAFKSNSGMDLNYVLGSTFLRNYYTIFTHAHNGHGSSVTFGELK